MELAALLVSICAAIIAISSVIYTRRQTLVAERAEQRQQAIDTAASERVEFIGSLNHHGNLDVTQRGPGTARNVKFTRNLVSPNDDELPDTWPPGYCVTFIVTEPDYGDQSFPTPAVTWTDHRGIDQTTPFVV